MSDMSGNPHFQGLARFNKGSLTIPELSYMQAQATLALAWETRTANLIALISLDRVGGYVANRGAFAEVESRLGLNEGVTK